jgi:large subunit ribosomal protein L17
MASSLIIHKRIRTTLAKAKALRVYVEPLITRSKEDTTHNRREVFSYLQDNKAVTELFRVVSQKVADRPGGYTRILKTGNRLGDNAEMCLIELVDFNELYVSDSVQQKGAKRTRRGGKKVAAETVTGKTPVASVAGKSKKGEVIEEASIDETHEVIEEELLAEATEVIEEEPVAEVVEIIEEEPAAEAPEMIEEEPAAEAVDSEETNQSEDGDEAAAEEDKDNKKE